MPSSMSSLSEEWSIYTGGWLSRRWRSAIVAADEGSSSSEEGLSQWIVMSKPGTRGGGVVTTVVARVGEAADGSCRECPEVSTGGRVM